VLVRERVRRLERTRELGELEAGYLERQPADPPHGRTLEALIVLGLDHQQDRQRVAERDPTELRRGARVRQLGESSGEYS
jgi:hypothetical protein